MNLFKKSYCRIFQSAFYMIIPILPYREPQIFTDVTEVPSFLRKKQLDRVLLVTDETVRSLGITKQLEDAAAKEKIVLTVYDRTVPNPTSENVEESRTLYLQNDCQAIIGFGGGSSIDCAKAVGARIARPKKSLKKMKGILKVLRKTPLIIAIPTTAGTGSETTIASVITNSETRHKYPINDFCLIPSYAVLDPKVTRGLPKNITATTGMDALTHAVEAYIGRSTTKKTRREALEATALIFANLETCFNNGDDMQARANMLKASYLAGCAFTKSYIGYVHAVAHSLGGKYNVPHGLANAILLPIVLEAYGSTAHKKLRKMGIAAGVATDSDSNREGAVKFINAIKEMKRTFNIPDTISCVQKDDIISLSRCADKEANPLYPVPKLMNAHELEQFYYGVMEK